MSHLMISSKEVDRVIRLVSNAAHDPLVMQAVRRLLADYDYRRKQEQEAHEQSCIRQSLENQAKLEALAAEGSVVAQWLLQPIPGRRASKQEIQVWADSMPEELKGEG